MARSAPAGDEARGYFAVVLKWLWFLVLASLLAAGAATLSAAIEPPIYSAGATLRLDGGAFAEEFPEDAQESRGQLTLFYASVVERPGTLTTSAALSGTTADDLLNRATVTSDTQRGTVYIAVQDTDPARAAAQANALASTTIAASAYSWGQRFQMAQAQLTLSLNAVNARIATLRARAAAQHDVNHALRGADNREIAASLVVRNGLASTSVALTQQFVMLGPPLALVAAAAPPRDPIAPLPVPSALLGGLLGLLVAASIMHLMEFVALPTRAPMARLEQVGLTPAAALRGPYLGDPLLTHAVDTETERAYRGLAGWLRAYSRLHSLRSLLVASATPGEGATPVAINLAVTLARGETRVLLVDANLRHPTIHRYLGLPANQGLASGALASDPDITSSFPLAVSPTVPNLHVLVAGPSLGHLPSEILASARTRQLLDIAVGAGDAQALADVVILDASPLVTYPDAASLMGLVDGVLLVVDAAQIEPEELKSARDAIQWSGGHMIGVVLTRSSAPTARLVADLAPDASMSSSHVWPAPTGDLRRPAPPVAIPSSALGPIASPPPRPVPEASMGGAAVGAARWHHGSDRP